MRPICSTAARLPEITQSLLPVHQGVRVSDTVMLNGCASDTKATIAALEHRMADEKIDLPQHPAPTGSEIAQPQAPLKPHGEQRRESQ